MLVIAVETGFPLGGRVSWAGRRHDEDWADASSSATQAELFDAVFRALHDGEQVAFGIGKPGLAELARLLDELGSWRPWTRVSTSLARWRANTSILVWQADPAPGAGGVTASAAVDSFFLQLPAARARATDEGTGTVVNVAAAAAHRAGLLADASELSRPAVTITVTGPSAGTTR